MAGDLINGEIPDHWEFTTLGEICQRGGGNIQTGPFGSQLHASDYVPVGVPSIMPTNIGENRIVEDGIVRITEDDANRLGQHRLRAGDIIYSRRGDVEKRALIREREEGWFCGTGCLKVRLGSGVVDPLFASLFLGHPAIREWIVRHAVGATMPNLNTTIMSAVPFALPPLAEQKAIAAVLGALDDKIELNRRMNATLEAMARALFQSWFVDFDPVRAKLDGRLPTALDPATAALFPDSFEHQGGCLIPQGWEMKCTADLFEVRDGTHDSPKRHEHGFPLITSTHITNGGVDIANAYRISEEDFIQINKRSKVDKFDTLMTMIGTVGVPLLVHEREPNFAIKNIALFKTSNAREFSYYFYLYLISPEMQQFLESRLAGTTQAFLSLGILRSLPILVPDSSVLFAFNKICEPLFEIIGANRRQTETLATLRDTLLPKLLSGELSVAQTPN